MRTAVLAAVLLIAPAAAWAAEDEACGDIAVIGRVVDQVPGPAPVARPNEIIMHRPWTLRIDVDRVVMGRLSSRRIVGKVVAHGPPRRDRDFLFLLRKRPDGDYDILSGALGPSEGDLLQIARTLPGAC